MAQWRGNPPANAGDWFRLWSGKIPHAGEQVTLRATATESPGAAAAEPALWNHSC